MTAWKPIETAPRDGTRILILHEERFVVTAFSSGEVCWRESWSRELIHGKQTHWMPIPEFPE